MATVADTLVEPADTPVAELVDMLAAALADTLAAEPEASLAVAALTSLAAAVVSTAVAADMAAEDVAKKPNVANGYPSKGSRFALRNLELQQQQRHNHTCDQCRRYR